MDDASFRDKDEENKKRKQVVASWHHYFPRYFPSYLKHTVFLNGFTLYSLFVKLLWEKLSNNVCKTIMYTLEKKWPDMINLTRLHNILKDASADLKVDLVS